MSKQPAAAGVYEASVKTIDGKEKSMSDYKGHVLLIVNTASECGFTPQYEALEALNKKYRAQGLRVLGFPANDFGAQEPGSNAQIAQFCRLKYAVTFDMFSKVAVKGPGMHPLFQTLTAETGGDIEWNFTKFLIDRQGRVAARFSSADNPSSSKVMRQVEKLLEQP